MKNIEKINNAKLMPINAILNKYGISDDYIINYGKYIAKIDIDNLKNTKAGKLILVTSISPTIYGEGKTTTAIGLVDALNKLDKNAVAILREPALGPVFGTKGGATGGGCAKVIPSDDINLHFTGDMSAICTANNLLCAIIDNHIFQGNELKIKNVVLPRTIDINDRALRNITINSSYNREDHFILTVASELMACVCLANDFKELKEMVANMIVAYNDTGKPIYTKDLQAVETVCILLKETIKPNVVQTLEHNLAFVHGGPFANIAHGTASIRAIKTGLENFSYSVVEAGFGSDLGAEKFFDIVCPKGNFYPNVVILNATIRALKYNGQDNLKEGLANLQAHIDNMLNFSKNIIVSLNKFSDDSIEDINIVRDYVKKQGLEFDINDTYSKGSNGGLELAQKTLLLCNNDNKKIVKLYDDNLKLKEKILALAKKVYHAKEIVYSKEAEEKIKSLEALKLDKYPICVSKTPMSISDSKELLGYPKDFTMHVTDIKLNRGAGFIVVLMGNVITLPGLNKNSNYLKMHIDDNGNIKELM